jgi:hypothetical protein
MVLTIEPCLVPSPKRSSQRKVEESSMRAGLEAYAPNDLLVGGTRLVL